MRIEDRGERRERVELVNNMVNINNNSV